jgi:sugar lactone lactonase YvrE
MLKKYLPPLLIGGFLLTILVACGGGGSAGGGGSVAPGGGGTVTPPPALALWAGNAGGRGNLDGQGGQARFWDPAGITVDSHGNLFVIDNFLNTIRKITPEGAVTTFAGTSGTVGSADGMGADARFNFDKPSGITVDKNDNLFVADVGNNTIRKITPSGLVTTVVGQAGQPALSGNPDGIGTQARLLFCFEEIGCPAPGMAVDSSGTLYFVEAGRSVIRKVTPAGEVRTIWGQICGYGIQSTDPALCTDGKVTGLAIGADDRLYISENTQVRVMGPDGKMQAYAGDKLHAGRADGVGTKAGFSTARGLTADKSGNLYVLDGGQLVRIAKDTTVTTLAGGAAVTDGGSNDGSGKAARFSNPSMLATDQGGNIYIVDTGNQTIRKSTPAGVVSTLAGEAELAGAADGTGSAARFAFIEGMVFDPAGNLFVADTQNNTIRKVTPDAAVTTFAGRAGVWGSDDGTGSAARFWEPAGMAIDSAGNLLVADMFNNLVRKISPAGVVSTPARPTFMDGGSYAMAAHYFQPRGVAVDANGNMLVADTGNNVIRKVDRNGAGTTLAGYNSGLAGSADGTGSAARFYMPFRVICDSAGNVYVADAFNHTIRKITPAGVTTTFAGRAGQPDFADGAGAQARFSRPEGLAIDSADNLYVADSFNHLVRKITPAGVVSTVVGQPGRAGFRAGPLPGSLLFPTALAIKGRSLYIATSKGIVVANDVP